MSLQPAPVEQASTQPQQVIETPAVNKPTEHIPLWKRVFVRKTKNPTIRPTSEKPAEISL